MRTPEARAAVGMLCGIVGILLNILLFCLKFLAGTLTASVAITADAYNNLCDAGSSLLSIVGFKLSAQKADTGHPFGHGRFEYIFGLFIAIGILLTGYTLFRESLDAVLNPKTAATFNTLSLVILGVSILVKLYMAFYNRRIGKRTGSASMRAVAADSIGDVAATGAVLICAILSRFFGLHLDAWCGMGVAAFIAFNGVKSAYETIAPLLGKPPEKELIEEICAIVLAFPEVVAVHDLIVHDYGPGRLIISLHAEVPADGDLLELHDVIDNAERALRQKLHCEATIHMDPVAHDDEETLSLKEKTAALARQLGDSVTIHDFRVVKGTSHTNLIFDVVVPYKFALRDAEVKTFLQNGIRAFDENFFAVIDVDKDFTGAS